MSLRPASQEIIDYGLPTIPHGRSCSVSAEPKRRAISILLVDDHPLLREGVAAVIGLQSDMVLVGEAENGSQAIERFRQTLPDVTLMDLQMPEMGGVEAIQAIRAESPAARILVLTTYAGDVLALRAMKAGAAGYLLKSSLRKELVDTIRAVHAGRRHVSAEIASEIAVHAVDDQLSDREVSILNLIANGHANKAIGLRLSISEETVKAHLKNIFFKLDVADRTHAVTMAVRRGFIQL
jgi:DNA-binding NarL/FixJ family response regulator